MLGRERVDHTRDVRRIDDVQAMQLSAVGNVLLATGREVVDHDDLAVAQRETRRPRASR